MQPSFFIYYSENNCQSGKVPVSRKASKLSATSAFVGIFYHKKRICQGVLKNFFKKVNIFSFFIDFLNQKACNKNLTKLFIYIIIPKLNIIYGRAYTRAPVKKVQKTKTY